MVEDIQADFTSEPMRQAALELIKDTANLVADLPKNKLRTPILELSLHKLDRNYNPKAAYKLDLKFADKETAEVFDIKLKDPRTRNLSIYVGSKEWWLEGGEAEERFPSALFIFINHATRNYHNYTRG